MNTKIISTWIIVPLITALCISGPNMASGSTLNFVIHTAYSFPDGTNRYGTSSLQVNTATHNVTGLVDPGSPGNGNTQWIWIPIAACLLICFPAPLEGNQSLLELSNDDIFGTMHSDFGAAGSAIFTSHMSGNSAVMTADLTGLDFALLPTPFSNFNVISDARVVGTGLGAAKGTSTVSLFGINVSNNFTYNLLGNPTASVSERLIHNEINVSETGLFSGNTSVSTIPLPATLWLFVSGLLGLGAIKKDKRLHT